MFSIKGPVVYDLERVTHLSPGSVFYTWKIRNMVTCSSFTFANRAVFLKMWNKDQTLSTASTGKGEFS